MVTNGADDHEMAKRALSEALRRWNALPDADQEREMADSNIAEIIARTDAEQAAEERAERVRLADEVAAMRQQVAELTAAAQPKPEPIVRSRLTPKEKSQIIRERGKAFYDNIPWK